jgi:1,4-dihydroxy-6-naphthoate synthase
MIHAPDAARPLSVAVSPCPNDTFIFAAWVLGLAPGPQARFHWADVQRLNQDAAAGRFDVVKLSAAAALALEERYAILPCGGAFGTATGPKLVARPDSPQAPATVAVPGLDTTAFAVLRAALGPGFTPLPMRFDRIAAAVARGRADAGLLIHETALVPERHGLTLRLDLGAWWAGHTQGAPLPLGVIAVRRDLPPAARQGAAEAIRASLALARARREAVWPLVRALARELDDPTLEAHIAAYVDDRSLDMGPTGRAALETLRALVRPGPARP